VLLGRPSAVVGLTRRAFESGQYGYGAALALFLIVIGVTVALLGWRFFDMERLLQRPRIEVL